MRSAENPTDIRQDGRAQGVPSGQTRYMSVRGRGVSSISAYLGTLLLLQTVVVLAVGALAVKGDFDSARDAAYRRAGDLASLASQEISSAVGMAQTAIGSQSRLPAFAEVFDDPQNCVLTSFGAGVFTEGQLELIRADGSVACTSRDPPAGRGYG